MTHLRFCGPVLAALTLIVVVPVHAQVSTALAQKAPEATSLLAIARRDGNVPVIVEFARPSNAAVLTADPASRDAVRAEIASTRSEILSAHFGSATVPRRSDGFNRSLQTYDVLPMFAARVTGAELEALAADARIVRINENKVGRAN